MKRNILYSNIRNNCKIDKDNGIQLEIILTTKQISLLKTSVENFIIKTLESYHGGKYDKNTFLVENRDQIIELPNRTPNGAFYPKKENIDQYNELQKNINKIVVETNLVDELESFDLCTVRIVDGKKTHLDKRNAATVKLHSDAWSGQYGDAMVTTALLGDETTSLEFHEAVGIKSNFFDTQPNYDVGFDNFEDSKLLGNLRFNRMTIFDHSCLHRTIKNDGGLRVSIDFSIKLKSSKEINKNKSGRDVTHKSIKDMLRIGRETFIKATETLDECHNRFKNDNYDKVAVSHISDIIS